MSRNFSNRILDARLKDKETVGESLLLLVLFLLRPVLWIPLTALALSVLARVRREHDRNGA